MSLRTISGVQTDSNGHDAVADFFRVLFSGNFEQLGSFPVLHPGENGSFQATLNLIHDLHEAGYDDLGVASQDVNADLEEATELGAKVLQARTAKPFGPTFGIFETPDGSIIFLVEAKDNSRQILGETG